MISQNCLEISKTFSNFYFFDNANNLFATKVPLVKLKKQNGHFGRIKNHTKKCLYDKRMWKLQRK